MTRNLPQLILAPAERRRSRTSSRRCTHTSAASLAAPQSAVEPQIGERQIRRRHRPGDLLLALPRVRPAGPDRLAQPEGARADLSAARLGGARPARDPAQRHRGGRTARSPAGGLDAARPGRGRHRQPARDDAWSGIRDTGEPIAQRDRLAGHAHRPPLPRSSAAELGQDRFRDRCGLPLATYFSGPKVRWLLDNAPGPAPPAEEGELLFGTIDTWLIWNLTGRHVTDVTNASRTMLMNLTTLDWDDDLLDAIGVPRAMLPEIRPSSRGLRRGRRLSEGVPVAAALGDQQAALFGQTCFSRGRGQVHLRHRQLPAGQHRRAGRCPPGTGCSPPSATRSAASRATYALEGSIAVTGALVQWLRDNLGLIASAAEIETLARTVDDNGGCYFVPGVLRAVRAALARRRPRRDRRAHRLRHQGPPRPRRARGDRLADARGRRRHERRLRRSR